MSEHAHDAHGSALDLRQLEVFDGGGEDIVRRIDEEPQRYDYEDELKTIASGWDKRKRRYY